MSANVVKVTVREYPDGDGEYSSMTLRAHWNRKDRVVIELGGNDYTFIMDDIRKALRAVEEAT